MSKRAEEAANRLYPLKEIQEDFVINGFKHSSLTGCFRTGVIQGYNEAEKDLALTWEDINKIGELIENVKNDFCDNPNMLIVPQPISPKGVRKAFNEEVLRRFNEWRGKR